jgi:DMSO/TMAO reductase YedYZ molybdopterin-dependent catalytic subunit
MIQDQEGETGQLVSRRAFLGGAALAAVPLIAAGQGNRGPRQGEARQPFPGLIVRQQQPDNLEMPFSTLDSFLTPTERFYVRNHFAVPQLNVRTWRLRVEGNVQRPLELTYKEVRRLPPRTMTALLECSGNNRVYLTPRAAGVAWGLGAVGTAEWTGVPLAAVLDRAGVRDGSVEVILQGADAGVLEEFPNPFRTPGPIPFARSLPLARAREQDVVLAHGMNGADLPATHGYPLRAVVPGWYGMASVKWLTRIIVTDRPFQGYFQSLEYAYFERRQGLPVLVPVTELQVKAQIARPFRNEVVPAGRSYRVHGAAWTGDSEVDRVEVSTDGGGTWEEARLLGRPVPHAWRLWEHTWRVPAHPGSYRVQARAHDRRGRLQPAERDPYRRNAMISHVLPVPVEVR